MIPHFDPYKENPLCVDNTTPEQNLLAAVLQRAAWDIWRRGEISGEEYRTAWRFVRSDKTEEFSFLWICEMLRLDPIQIRSLIMDGITRPKPLSCEAFFE